MTTLLYFGSFNPVHYGHLSIVRYLYQDRQLDEIRLVVSPKNPLKKAEDLADARQRLLEVASSVEEAKKRGFLSAEKPITVSDVEFDLPQPLYTINTLHHLQRLEPDQEFILLIGGDNISSIEKWFRYEQLLVEFQIWVYPRHDRQEEERACQSLEKRFPVRGIRYLKQAPLLPISSTLIRAGLAQQWSEDLSGSDAPA